MGLKKDLQTSAAMEAELNKERASALGRTGARLELHLERCEALLDKLCGSTGAERRALLAEYRDERAEAEKWRWYLTIQREAMGLRRHDDVERLYPTPPAMRDE
ncbi:MAG: hypothetical protein AMXMBFR34_10120 [Myxococcaceae bacterium]